MIYTSTIFRVKFNNNEDFHIKGQEAKEIHSIFRKEGVHKLFDEKRVDSQNLTLFRVIDYRKDGDSFISIDIKSKVIQDTLSGEEFLVKQDVFNIFQQSTVKLSSIKFSDIEPKKIQEAKKYIIENYPEYVGNIKKIQDSKYLYTDRSNKFIYFPQFLRKIGEGSFTNREISNYQKLRPNTRYKLLRGKYLELIVPILRKYNISLDPLNSKDFQFVDKPTFIVGKNTTWQKNRFYDLSTGIKNKGFYFNTKDLHNIIIIDASSDDYQSNKKIISDKFIPIFSKEVRTYKFNININYLPFKYHSNINIHEVDKRIGFDFIKYVETKYSLSEFMPLVIHSSMSKISDLIYKSIKRALINKGIPTQFVSIESIRDDKKIKSAMSNIIFGLFSKFGNIPYILDSKSSNLEIVDYLIGYDVSRDKKNGNTRNYAGGTYFFGNSGRFEKVIKFYPEGEILRESELKKAFPPHILQNKRVVVHRDGDKKVNEVKELIKYFKAYNIKAHIIYITKRHTARVFKYLLNDNTRHNPDKGAWIQYEKNKALVVTSDSTLGTKQPLKIEYLKLNDNLEFKLEDLVKNIVDLTYLYYGSISDTSLPITTLYSHKISKLIKDGIEPNEDIFYKPYWI